MHPLERPLSDRFWPVFLGCFALGTAAVGSVVCVALGRLELAERLDAYWWLGLALSLWMFPAGTSPSESRKPGMLDAPLNALTIPAMVAWGGIVVAILIVLGAERILSAPWSTVVHGAVLGPYLLGLCVATWLRDSRESDRGGERPHSQSRRTNMPARSGDRATDQ